MQWADGVMIFQKLKRLIYVPGRKSEKEKYCYKEIYDPICSLVAGNSVSIE